MADRNKTVLPCIVTALVVVICVHYIFNNSDSTYNGSYINKRSDKTNRTRNRNSKEAFDNSSKYSKYNQQVISDQWRSLNFEKVKTGEPLDFKYNDEASKNYVTKQLLGAGCPQPSKSADQFHKDFFGFRDMTLNNSSIREDPVDKIQQLYLQGNLSRADKYCNIKIKDIFDSVTATPKEYLRQCVRLPNFDDTNSPGYQMSYGQTPLQLNGDTWSYPNEKIINGGVIKPGLRGADPYDNFNLPVSKLDENLIANYGHKYK